MSRLQKGLAWGCAAVAVVAIALAVASQILAGFAIVAFYALVALVLLVIERANYKPLLEAPPAGWRASDERFVDPESGRLVTVWSDPGSGRRAYVAGPVTEAD